MGEKNAKKAKKEQNKEGGKGNLIKIIGIVVGFLLILGVVAFGAYYFASTRAPKVVINDISTREEMVDEAFFDTDEQTLNLTDKDAKKYIQIKIVLAYDKKNKKLGKEVEEKKPTLMDVILEVIRSKSSKDLLEGRGSEKLKLEIKDRLNTHLNEGKLSNVYFNKFIIQ